MMKKFLLGLALALFSLGSVAEEVIVYPGSGSYYDPNYSGSGVVLNEFGNEPDIFSVVYWYTYDSRGNQMWLVGIETSRHDGVIEYDLHKPSGVGIYTEDHEFGERVGVATMGHRVFQWNLEFGGVDFCDGFSPIPPWCSGGYLLIKL